MIDTAISLFFVTDNVSLTTVLQVTLSLIQLVTLNKSVLKKSCGGYEIYDKCLIRSNLYIKHT